MDGSNNKYAIECSNITKSFGSVKANDHIDLQVGYGEILALLGENGSGKTTLMNILSGIYYPDEGEVIVNGTPVTINSPTDASRLGIGMIHQHFKLVDVFSAMDNIILGTKEKRISPKLLKDKILTLCKTYGLEIDPQKKVYEMSVSEKQTVEIVKVLYGGAKILILDEPTAVLTPQETRKLFDILREMRKQGNAIIIITHKLNEVMEISDRVTILRKGRVIQTVATSKTNEIDLTTMMVGKKVDLQIERPIVENQKHVLKVRNLEVTNKDGIKTLKNVNFDLSAGEIIGVAGVAGSGQKELCEAITGLQKISEGSIQYHDIELAGKTPREIMKCGIRISFVPEDRLGMGLIGTMGITDNILLKTYRNGKGMFVDRKPAKQLADQLVEKLRISTPGIGTPVRLLSGGNVQKVLLGREIEMNPSVLITAYPVRGLDINSTYTVYDLINQQKKAGVAVLFIGEDLDVLLALADKILVLCNGEAVGFVNASEITKEEVGMMMGGGMIDESAAETR
ncbi:MAG: ABC transporter ATP-binding protein [Clostridia bacterium]|nr:ABC transporter ATP-binding protein [Clostridia bacterium]